MKKRALISVFDKRDVLELAAFLVDAGWELLSTGGTSAYLRSHALPVLDVSAVTGFPECLDGRVKTLHPAIHGGLLAKRDNPAHQATLKERGIEPIDLLCVNLYPFFEKVQEARAGALTMEETIEFIDIGGPAMLRSAAKNFKDALVLTDPADYRGLIQALKTGEVPLAFRRRLAAKVFALTSAYDGAIARYLAEQDEEEETEKNAYRPLPLRKAQTLRYGENGHQRAALYYHADQTGALGYMEQLQGKELGYNNIRDLDLAWKGACAFGLASDGTPPLGDDEVRRLVPGGGDAAAGNVCCVAVKHNTPCGAALAPTLREAYRKAYACDPVSIFGGILACNTTVDRESAEEMAGIFLEIIVAPDFTGEALAVLAKKRDLRLMRAKRSPREREECVSVDGGMLIQETNRRLLDKWEVPTKAQPPAEDIADMLFGMRTAAFVKSNAIVAVQDLAAVGIGGGETNRIWAAELALTRAAARGARPRTLASDAFFPFPDVVEAAAAAGIRSIIQTGGSLNDKLSVAACDRLGIAMVFTGTRLFKH